MESFYRQLLKRALKISWRNKWLWILGIFTIIVGNVSVYEVLIRGFSNLNEGKTIFETMREYSASGLWGMFSFENIKQFWQTDLAGMGMLFFDLLLTLSIFLIFISAGIISQGALIWGFSEIDSARRATLRESLRKGVHYFWPVLGLNIITKIILMGTLLFLAYLISLIVTPFVWLNILIYIFSFLFFTILGIVIYFLTIYGAAFIVKKQKNVFESLKNAYQFFCKNIVVNLEMALILFVLNMFFVLIYMVAVFIGASPFLVLYFLFMFAGSKLGVVIVSALLLVVVVLVLLVGGSFWGAFHLSIWVAMFDYLLGQGGKSKVLRVINQFKKTKK